ncbi:MAG: T9SS type A sorting domain-containing protein [Bacteroidales bacterium]
MKQLITLILLLGFNTMQAQQFYNYYPSALNQYVYSETDVLAMGNACYKIETESNIAVNFHSNVRIVKVQPNGSIIWIKRYDAGIDSSIVATSITKTLDNKIIVTAILDNDNSFPPIGVTVFKLDTAGAVLWSVVFPGFRWGYESRNTIQLPDSTYALDAVSITTFKPVVIKLHKNGTRVSAKSFQNTLYSGDPITSMQIKNNTVSIAFKHGEFITTDTACNILTDKKYNLDPSLPYFTHTVTANGDYVFLSDVVAGGVLTGRFRIFRTTSSGELLWAKTLSMWTSFSVHEPYTLFDVVQGVEVTEDTSMNLVAHLVDEGGHGLAVTFDENGNYLTNKLIKASSFTLCDDGDFLFASNSQSSSSLGIFAKQAHYSINDCDSLVDVIISNGTDSASVNVPVASSVPVPISLTNYPIHVYNGVSDPGPYCQTATGISDLFTPNEYELKIFPNPATNILTVNLQDGFANGEMKITNMAGEVVHLSIIESAAPMIDISGFPKGVYIIDVVKQNKKSRNKFIK